jgi:hypothetical protein
MLLVRLLSGNRQWLITQTAREFSDRACLVKLPQPLPQEATNPGSDQHIGDQAQLAQVNKFHPISNQMVHALPRALGF